MKFLNYHLVYHNYMEYIYFLFKLKITLFIWSKSYITWFAWGWWWIISNRPLNKIVKYFWTFNTIYTSSKIRTFNINARNFYSILIISWILSRVSPNSFILSFFQDVLFCVEAKIEIIYKNSNNFKSKLLLIP